MGHKVRRSVEALAVTGGAAVMLRPGSATRRRLGRQADRLGRRLQYFQGQLQGVSYRLRGRHPDPEVIDQVLADRIRSALGPLEKRLDVPHVHVMVEHHVALLHGEVGTASEADQIERDARQVSGVRGVESYLHVGLIDGDTRPSVGHQLVAPSDAMRRLVDAAVGAGAQAPDARQVVRAVLAAFAERLPAAERDQVACHLPADARAMFGPPRRTHAEHRPRTEDELVSRVATSSPTLATGAAGPVTEAVVSVLRSLVPDEAAGVSAVLPEGLRELWSRAPAP